MRFYTQQHEYYCGIDLHTKTMYLCILDQYSEIFLHHNTTVDVANLKQLITPFLPYIVIVKDILFSCRRFPSSGIFKEKYILGNCRTQLQLVLRSGLCFFICAKIICYTKKPINSCKIFSGYFTRRALIESTNFKPRSESLYPTNSCTHIKNESLIFSNNQAPSGKKLRRDIFVY